MSEIAVCEKELADEELLQTPSAGMEKVFFAWAGGSERTTIPGPTFVIEYDNTQDHANHIHTVWRNFDYYFGVHRLLDQPATAIGNCIWDTDADAEASECPRFGDSS